MGYKIVIYSQCTANKSYIIRSTLRINYFRFRKTNPANE